jgi:hypothetical protein
MTTVKWSAEMTANCEKPSPEAEDTELVAEVSEEMLNRVKETAQTIAQRFIKINEAGLLPINLDEVPASLADDFD